MARYWGLGKLVRMDVLEELAKTGTDFECRGVVSCGT
jgi:hypothetical protein